MTTSVLSAILFSFMCYALPTSSGKAILQGPHPVSMPRPSEEGGQGGQETIFGNTLVLGEYDFASEPEPASEQDVVVCVSVASHED